jgi:CMP-N,N'-diacetyllegionaminic acid synthase
VEATEAGRRTRIEPACGALPVASSSACARRSGTALPAGWRLVTSRAMGSVLALIPARSGSKSLPDKNVRPFRGRPLLAHSVEQALAAPNVDRVIVSTDSQAYAEIARQAGAEVPFVRPPEISGDLTPDIEVFLHALSWLDDAEGYRPEYCVHLRPTYPTRRIADIVEAVELLRRNGSAHSVRSVAPAPHTPYKMWTKADDGSLRPLLASDIPEAHSQPRQKLPVVFLQNAAVDVVRSAVIRELRSMCGTRVLPYVMDRVDDIDNLDDFWTATSVAAPGPNGLTFAVSFDVLCVGDSPLLENVGMINRLHDAGNVVVVHAVDDARDKAALLKKWGVRYQRLEGGRPRADYYIEDNAVRSDILRRWMEPQAAALGLASPRTRTELK